MYPQERFQVKNPPHTYIQKLRGYLDPGVTRKVGKYRWPLKFSVHIKGNSNNCTDHSVFTCALLHMWEKAPKVRHCLLWGWRLHVWIFKKNPWVCRKREGTRPLGYSYLCLTTCSMTFLLHYVLQKFRRRVQESTKVLRELEISLRTNHIG